MIRISDIRLSVGRPEADLVKKAAHILGLRPAEVISCTIYRRSVDARKKAATPHYSYVVDVEVKNPREILKKGIRNVSAAPDMEYKYPKCVQGGARPVVAGFGPAGMFSALILAQLGLRPVVLERGRDIESRTEAVERFWRDGELDTESNVQFGEGGAGAFSDGKLTARTKDLRSRKVFTELVRFGAPEEILYDGRPHIGTDRLREVVRALRLEIIRLGGEVRFESRLTGIRLENGAVTGAEVNGKEVISADSLVLALGHSARDTLETLYESGIKMERKPFAAGVRIEHPQAFIDERQYGSAEIAEKLGPADYKLTYTAKGGRGVYSFCMCPGGSVVAAASEQGRLAVNGMSMYARDGENANSALLVQLSPEDYPSEHPLAGIQLQRELEQRAFEAGGGDYRAPAQYLGAFLGRNGAEGGVQPTYRPGVRLTDLSKVLPDYITEALKEAIPEMGRRLKGFDMDGAMLTAVESRSSSPVRILRDAESRESLSAAGLYPVGEGAGYAGGIVSAAVDGILAAERIAEKTLAGEAE